MGLRVRRSIKLLPGVRINLSKSGVSTSIGVKGATINLRPSRKARATVGIPGTGLSYSSQLESSTRAPELAAAGVNWRRIFQAVGAFFFVIGAVGAAGNSGEPLGWICLIGGGITAYKFKPLPAAHQNVDSAP